MIARGPSRTERFAPRLWATAKKKPGAAGIERDEREKATPITLRGAPLEMNSRDLLGKATGGTPQPVPLRASDLKYPAGQSNVAVEKFASYFDRMLTLKEQSNEAQRRTTRTFRGTGHIG